MNDENLQLRNCSDCIHNGQCDGINPCDWYEYDDSRDKADDFDRVEDYYNE